MRPYTGLYGYESLGLDFIEFVKRRLYVREIDQTGESSLVNDEQHN